MAEASLPIEVFIKSAATSATRVPGTAVFMTTSMTGVPHALLHNLKHNKVLHERVMLLTVRIEDVPFVIVDYDIKNPGPDQAIDLTTNMDDIVALGPDHGLELRAEPRGGVPVPYIEIRKGLYARLSRPVYYKLIDLAIPGHGMMILRSRGTDQILGRVEQDNAE